MQRIVYTKRQREALQAAAEDRPSLGSRLTPVVTVAGREVSPEDCEYHGQEDEFACVLTGTFSGRFPDSDEGENVEVTWLVDAGAGSYGGPEELPGFEGRVVSVSRIGAYTDLIGATGGYEADRTPLGEGPAEDRDWSGLRPDTALYDVLSVLASVGLYRGMEIPRVRTPPISNYYSWVEFVGKVLKEIEEAARVKVADTQLNVASLYPLVPISLSPGAHDLEWHFEEGRDANDVSDGTPEGERYARVMAYREERNGTNFPLASAAIDNGGRRINPRSAYPVKFDADADADSGYALAYAEAMRLGSLERAVSVPANYPPFMVARGDNFWATARDPIGDSRAVVTTLYSRCHAFSVDVVGKSGTVSGEGLPTGVREEALRAPVFDLARDLRPPWGVNAAGYLYFERSLPWVRVNAEGYLEFLETPGLVSAPGEYVEVRR